MASSITKADFIVWGIDQTASGPMELPALVSLVEHDGVTADTWVFVVKNGSWRRAAEVSELQMFFAPKSSSNQPGMSVAGVDFQVLRGLKLLAGLNDEQLQRFVEFVEVQRVPQWATVVKQGDRGDAMYLILQGELSVRTRVSGADTLLARLSLGDVFGDIALFDQGPRSADVVCDTSAVLLRISSASLADMTEKAPELASPFLMAIGRTLAARMRAGNRRRLADDHLSRVFK
jgi:hypothetical protein